MSIPGSVVPQLLVNIVMFAGALTYLIRSSRGANYRLAAVALMVMACVGLWFNLHGENIEGWQEGFRRD